MQDASRSSGICSCTDVEEMLKTGQMSKSVFNPCGASAVAYTLERPVSGCRLSHLEPAIFILN